MEVGEALDRVIDALPGVGERRAGQREMAQAVAGAVESGRHLIVQAGTGTGKSLAYLIPALLSGKRTVVATATKALQDQLAEKDLPLLDAHLGVPVRFAVLKGRSNYLCRQRAAEVMRAGDDGDRDASTLDLEAAGADVADSSTVLGRQVLRLVEWSHTTESGDRADLDFEPMARAWSSVSVSAMECPGAIRCPSGAECFAEAARRRADDADIVVVNSHLYGAHLASGGNVIPPHDVVVFDEAHELEAIASSSLGLELTAGRFRSVAYAVRRLVGDHDTVGDVLEVADRFDATFEPLKGQRLLPGRDDVAQVLELAATRVRNAIAALRSVEDDNASRARSLQAASHLVGDVDVVNGASLDHVVWVEVVGAAAVVRIAPVDVSEVLSERLWTAGDDGAITAVLTSATVPRGLAARLGIPPDAFDELDVGTPFDFEQHALLYCAAHLPDPRSPGYEAAMHDELVALLDAAGGRTLALFTSRRAMAAAANDVATRVPYRVLSQSDLPKPALLREFRDDETSCLFATMGFWQGVDVPGAALSQVVIDRLPFAPPDEPLLQARRQRAGANAFRLIDLPRAATLLAQGAGRLIRSSSDRGVVAVLDPRLASGSYRWDLVNALPPMRRTRNRDDVVAFFTAAPCS